jgi:hypothetical protein
MKTATPYASRITPMRALCCGATAGFAATVLLSGLSRVLPGMNGDRARPKPKETPNPPTDPFDPHQVQEWQERSWSPAAYQVAVKTKRAGAETAEEVTPASVLVQPQGPGPEGLAEQFAFKVGAGVFDKDISPYVKPAGLATHLVYGSLWGALYGLIRASYQVPHRLAGALFGLGVYAVGPAWLVPAMKLMGYPPEEPPLRTGMMVAGHVVYGVAVAEAFESMERRVS